jgi:hypothetical protein
MRALLLAVAALLAGCGAESAGECGTLLLAHRGAQIEATFTVTQDDRWRIVVVHEGHVKWRGYQHGAFTVRQRFNDYRGADHVMARATGARGAVCTVTSITN